MKICFACGHHFDSTDWTCPRCRKAPEEKGGRISFMDGSVPHGESYNPEHFSELFNLEKDSFWFRHRARLVLKCVERFFPNAERVLEIGCGTGFVLSRLRESFPGMAVSGSDLFTEGLRFAAMRIDDARFYRMDACHMPFDGEFDLILALDILEHIEDDEKALKEIYRSIRPGGGAIVTVPQHRWLWTIQDEKALHQRRYVRSELVGRMNAQGFRIAYATSFISLLLPVMALSRLYGWFSACGRKQYDPLRELKMNPGMNGLMQTVCMVEERILNAGMSLPAGGSLLCVGIKEG